MKDIGKFVGWYFYLGALLEIVGSIYTSLITNEVKLNFSFVFTIVIGYFLIQHNNITRKLVLFLSGFGIALCSLLIIIFTFAGINGVFHIYVNSIRIEINNLMDLYFCAISAIISCLIPFLLLNSKKAIKEFEGKEVSV